MRVVEFACYETLFLPLYIFKYITTEKLQSVYLNTMPQRNTERFEVKFCAFTWKVCGGEKAVGGYLNISVSRAVWHCVVK